MTDKRPTRFVSKGTRRRSAARLAAVQALYQVELSGASADAVLTDLLQHRIAGKAPQTIAAEEEDQEREVDTALVEPDGELLTFLVRGALERRENLDEMIGAALSRDWTVGRLEVVLRAILRAGVYELLMRPEIPVKVVISEYVDIAHAFYAGAEPGLINAVLDRVARTVRAEDHGRDPAG